jgi:hypothetical protein
VAEARSVAAFRCSSGPQPLPPPPPPPLLLLLLLLQIPWNMMIDGVIVLGSLPLVKRLGKANPLDLATLVVMLPALAILIGLLTPDQVGVAKALRSPLCRVCVRPRCPWGVVWLCRHHKCAGAAHAPPPQEELIRLENPASPRGLELMANIRLWHLVLDAVVPFIVLLQKLRHDREVVAAADAKRR